MDYSIWLLVNGFCFTVYGLWFMVVYGSWFMVHDGLGFMVKGSGCFSAPVYHRVARRGAGKSTFGESQPLPDGLCYSRRTLSL